MTLNISHVSINSQGGDIISIQTINKIDEACNTYKKIQQYNNLKFKNLDEWLLKESNIFFRETELNNHRFLKFKRGQLIKVDFGINVGSELSHTHFAIVLNSDDTTFNDNLTVLPLTSKKGYKRINLGNLVNKNFKSNKYKNNTYGIITQIKTISKKRILLNSIKYICNDKELEFIDKEIIKYLTNQN